MAKDRYSLSARNTLVGLSFIMPNFAGFFIFILIPVVFSLFLSVMKWDGFRAMEFAGLDNFKVIFKDSVFRAAFLRTFVFAAANVGLVLFAALGMAVLLNKKIKAKGFFRSAIFFPHVASVVSIAVVWQMLFMKTPPGPINALLESIGIANPPGWFGSTKWALPGVIIVSIWRSMGYFMIVFLAALQDIPKELHEAASIDGATNFQFFWRIALPMLRPATFFVVLMLTINSFKSFDIIFALTEGGPGSATTLVSNYIYNNAFIYFYYGRTSAAAMVLFVIIAAITFFQFRMDKKLSQ